MVVKQISLSEKRLNLISAINIKDEQIGVLKGEIEQFQDAINLLEKPTKYAIAEGALPPLDALKLVQKKAKTDTEKLQQINDAKSALSLSLQSLQSLKVEKRQLETELKGLEIEIDWTDNYSDSIEKYSHEFTYYSDELAKNIRLCEKDLKGHKEEKLRIESYFNGNPQNLKVGSFRNGFRKLEDFLDELTNKIIPQFESRLDELKNTKLPDLKNDAKFRQWLIARVKIDEPLNRLKVAQDNYITAYNELQNLNTECRLVLKLDVNQLTHFERVIDGDYSLSRV